MRIEDQRCARRFHVRPRPRRRRRSTARCRWPRRTRLGAGDGQHARAAADVEEALAALQLRNGIEAQPRRRMSAGAERPPRIHVEHHLVRLRRVLLPRGHDHEAPDLARREVLLPHVAPLVLVALAARLRRRRQPGRLRPLEKGARPPTGAHTTSIGAEASAALKGRLIALLDPARADSTSVAIHSSARSGSPRTQSRCNARLTQSRNNIT